MSTKTYYRIMLAILAYCIIGTGVALASNPDGSITLTPSVLYDMIKETRDQTANISDKLRTRVNQLTQRVDKLENTSPINPSDTLRIQTLEKKVHSLTEIVKLMRERLPAGK